MRTNSAPQPLPLRHLRKLLPKIDNPAADGLTVDLQYLFNLTDTIACLPALPKRHDH
jgi:hypothetical protein